MKGIQKILILITIVFSVNCSTFAQTPTWLWAEGAGGFGDDKMAQIAADVNGNVYIAGVLQVLILILVIQH